MEAYIGINKGTKMKICYLADARSIHTKRWVEYFAKGYEVDLISLNYEQDEDIIPEDAYNKMGVRLHKVPRKMPFLLFTPFYIRRLIKDITPDIVHAHYLTHYGFCGAFSGFHPLVISAWGSDVLVDPKKSRIFRFMVKFGLNRADLITCNGDNLKEAIMELSKDHQKIKIVYHGVDTKNFNPSKRDKAIIKSLFKDDFPTVISTRGLKPIYDVESLIKAIPLVLKQVPDAKFIVANNGSQEAHLKEMVKSLDIWNSVRFVGLIQHPELPKYLASSDVYVSTSLSDGMALSTMEAMACKVALVITDVGDNRTWVRNKENGFIVPIKNSEALAEIIIYLLENEDIRKKFGEISRRRIEERGDYYREMEKMNGLYEEIIMG